MTPFLSGNAPLALSAAVAWGGGDFAGGMGVKAARGTTAGALRLVILAHASSLLVLLTVLALHGGTRPSGAPLAWGLLAGVAGGISLTAFYMALSRGAMGASAALSGLLAAIIPAVVSSVVEGVPGTLRLVGFALALGAIWIIAAGPATKAGAGSGDRGTLILAIVGGIGFGIYFVALRLANSLGTLEPMALARAASLTTCLLVLAGISVQGRMERRRNPHGASSKTVRRQERREMLFWAAGVALLDTGGNLLFLAATRLGRLDVAAVLASLYPASTILLAAWRLHERPTRRQLVGMGLAVLAVVAISV